MPYFVFQVKPFAQLEKLGEFAAFREASRQAKALRAAQAGAPGRIQVMFADNERLAEDLLCQIREPGPAGDE
jgi:hypothetical protein